MSCLVAPGRDLSTARQEALQATLEAAAKQMNAEERQRPGPGPPPLLAFVRALPLPTALRPRPVVIAPSNGSSSEGLEAGRLPGSISPFIYNPNRVCAFQVSCQKMLTKLLEMRSQSYRGSDPGGPDHPGSECLFMGP